MEVLAVIPARFDSSRFPGKPLAEIAGKSMIRRVCERVVQSKKIDRVIVATDDQRIYDHVDSFGFSVMMTSKDHKSGTERCAEIAQKFKDLDIVINIQGDEPIIDPAQIDVLAQAMILDPNIEIASMYAQITSEADLKDGNIVKVILDDSGFANQFQRQLSDDLNCSDDLFKHIGIYGYRVSTLKEIVKLKPSRGEIKWKLEQLRWVENDYGIKMIAFDANTYSVDVPSDVERIEALLKNNSI